MTYNLDQVGILQVVLCSFGSKNYLCGFRPPVEQCHMVNQVWPPEHLSFPDDNNLDIIFFEGNVMRDCADTWIQRRKPGVCWPRDWLPQHLGRGIRVFLLNYRIADGFGHVVENLQKHLVSRYGVHLWTTPFAGDVLIRTCDAGVCDEVVSRLCLSALFI